MYKVSVDLSIFAALLLLLLLFLIQIGSWVFVTCNQITSMAKVLVIGSGGREHALVWKLAQSNQVKEVWVSPGNGGTSNYQDQKSFLRKISNVVGLPAEFENLAAWCKSSEVDLVVVGPEAPLADGISNVLKENGIHCFGPSKRAAMLETSKEYSKNFMNKYQIPTARHKSFTSSSDAENYILNSPYPPLVVKASGLAAGKGVVVCESRKEACLAARNMLDDKKFGTAGGVVVIEEMLDGEEFSVLCFSDGKNIAVMPPIQDHKRALDGDLGPNTGGMGAYGPCKQLDDDALETIKNDILLPAIEGAVDSGHPFVGILYAGLMSTEHGIYTLEFNCRFGDPECQVLMSLLDSDLYTIMKQCCEGNLNPSEVSWKTGISSACVVLASGGYPGKYEKYKAISGIDACNQLDGVQVFEAGTTNVDGKKVTSGGRVLAVTSVAKSLEEAIAMSMHGADLIDFAGKFHRKDIGKKGVSFKPTKPGLTYSNCGVDIERGEQFVKQISSLASGTSRAGCNASLGGFGALFDLKKAGYSSPILVSGTDGVGTKLLLAHEANLYSTLGQDLVAMCVNDVLTHNAEPLFFLDYFSCGKLDDRSACKIIKGVADACNVCGCALAGGETAEMPGLYPNGKFDLAGFVVGAYDKGQHKALPAVDEIVEGDVVIGISSTGVHSNGFSLVREVIKSSGVDLTSECPFSDSKSLAENLLTPTALYSPWILPILRNQSGVKAAAHITGGGLPGNLCRVLPKHLRAVLDAREWRMPPVFGWIAKTGNVAPIDMYKTFNCGLGFCLVVSKSNHEAILKECNINVGKAGLEAWVVGTIEPMSARPDKVVVRNFKPVLESCWIKKEDSSTNVGVTHFKKDEKPKVAVLISGTGTNLQALIDHEKSGQAAYKIVLVISNVSTASGLDKAKAAGIATMVLNHKKYASRQKYDAEIHNSLIQEGIQLICLAGFMRLLSGWFTRTWQGRILNIHPSLLPSFKGMDAHEQVLKAGVRVTGCTVHFVTEKMDDGAIIAQATVPVDRNDNVSSLSDRVKSCEHQTYPNALDLVAGQEVTYVANLNKVTWA